MRESEGGLAGALDEVRSTCLLRNSSLKSPGGTGEEREMVEGDWSFLFLRAVGESGGVRSLRLLLVDSVWVRAVDGTFVTC